MGEKLERIMCVVEGREINGKMANELVEVSEKYGFKGKLVKTINSEKIVKNDLSDTFSDFVLWRSPVGYKNNYEVERVITWINDHCKVTLNTKIEGGRLCTSNKYYQHGLFMRDPVLSKHTLPMYPAFSKGYVLSLVEHGYINYPFIFKPDMGTRGLGIILVENEEDLNNFQGDYARFSVEPYIKSKYDWRTFVLGGVALGVMRKVGDEDDKRNFEARSGGRQRWNEEDPKIIAEVYNIAVRAAAVSGLDYAGVDVIRDDEAGNFYVLETNVCGGWQNGYTQTTGINVADAMMEWFLDRAMIYEKSMPEAVKTYVERRLRFLLKESKEKYQRIISFEEKSKMPESEARVLLESPGVTLEGKLQGAYALISLGKTTWVDKVKIQDLLSSIETYEISRFGNFIGKDSGSLEESLERTAYYLAVRSKLS